MIRFIRRPLIAPALASLALVLLPSSAQALAAPQSSSRGCTLLPSRQAVAEASLGQRGEFGAAVAIAGPEVDATGSVRHLCAVGSPRAMEAGTPRGSVRLFSLAAPGRTGSPCSASPRATLHPRDLSGHARFGAALTFGSAGLLAVGAPGADGTHGSRAGLVRLYRVGPLGGAGALPLLQLAELQPVDLGDGAGFGASLAMRADGMQLAVGAPMARSVGGVPFAGRVYVFDRANGGWTERFHAELPAPGVAATFGSSLAWVGGTLVVGAPGDGTVAPAAGRVVGIRGEGPGAGEIVWDLTAPASAHGLAGMRYGEAIAGLDGHTFAVGGRGHGVVEVLHLPSAGGPAHQALLMGVPGEGFGLGLAGAGDVLLVGSPFAAGPGSEVSAGCVELFGRHAGRWVSTGTLRSSYPSAGAEFGVAIAVAHGTDGKQRMLVGEPGSHAACGASGRCAAGAALVR